MIREFNVNDLPDLEEIFAANGLPKECFPDLYIRVGDHVEENKLFVDARVMEHEGVLRMACFLKATAEIFLIIDHTVGEAYDRLVWLSEMRDFMAERARKLGFDQVSAWIPPDLVESFGPRLEDLGFRKSWQSYTFNL